MSDNIERRFFPGAPELRASGDNKRQLRGMGIVFGSWSEDLGGFREMIEPESVEGLIEGADIRSFYNHDPAYVLGRTKSGTLRLDVTKSGVAYEVDLPNSRQDVHEAVSRGDVDGSSFTFMVAEGGDEWENKGGKITRRIKKMSWIGEIGPVAMPAYPRSKVSARAMELAGSLPDADAPEPPAVVDTETVATEHQRLKDQIAVVEATI